MKRLELIAYDEKLSAFDLRDDIDLFSTKVVLSDFDWMHYKISAWLPVKKYSDLHVKFEYNGMGNCEMIAKTPTESHKYEFRPEIFQEYLIKFLRKHISSWNRKYAFRGIKEVVELYNAVLTDPETVEMKHKRRRYKGGRVNWKQYNDPIQ